MLKKGRGPVFTKFRFCPQLVASSQHLLPATQHEPKHSDCPCQISLEKAKDNLATSDQTLQELELVPLEGLEPSPKLLLRSGTAHISEDSAFCILKNG